MIVITIIPTEMTETKNNHKKSSTSNMIEHLEKIITTLDYVTWILVAFSVFFGGVLLLYKSKLADAQKLQLKIMEDSIAVANKAAAEANKQAAEANERAAEANKKAEEERLARVKIEKQLAPRTFSESDIEEIGNALRSFAPSLSGKKVKISSYIIDAEANVFAWMINEILFRAGIGTEPHIGRIMPSGGVDIGVKITGPIKDESFMYTLASGIYARLKTNMSVEYDDKYKEVAVLVGVKPVAGLPKIVFERDKQNRE